MRTRTTGILHSGSIVVQDTVPGGSWGVPTIYASSAKVSGSISTISDTSTPSYGRVRRGGGVVLNDMNLHRDTRKTEPSNWTFGPVPVWGARRVSGDVAVTLAGLVASAEDLSAKVEQAQDRALLKAYSKVAKSDANVLVSVMEARKSGEMLLKPFGKAERLLKKMYLRKLQLAKMGVDAGKAAVSVWLEYRLGWKPLLYDISNIMEAYANRRHTDNYFSTLKVERSGATLSATKDSAAIGSCPGVPWVRVTGTATTSVSISAGVLYKFVDTSLRNFENRRYGMRLSDVPASLWELVPLSFVVDRFLEVGTWLDAIVPKPGVSFVGNWKSAKTSSSKLVIVTNAKVDVYVAPTTYYLNASGGTYREDIYDSVRRVNVVPPFVPSWNPNPLTEHQKIDHLTLASSRLGSILQDLGRYHK